MNFGVAFSPLMPAYIVWIALVIAAAIAALLLIVRSRGAAMRAGAQALLVLALANPSLTREDRDPLTSVAIVVIELYIDSATAMRVASMYLATSVRRPVGNMRSS